MKILLISDQYTGSSHSAVEGLFNIAMRQHADVSIVYFSRSAASLTREGNCYVAPHGSRRRGFFELSENILPLREFQLVIVRNIFPLLKQSLKWRDKYRYKVGFWESFPHSFRRIYEARETGRAIFRKRLEYLYKSTKEKELISKSDFYFPITETFKNDFRHDINVPHLTLPMGVDVSTLPAASPKTNDTTLKRFVYVGTIDRLRRIDLVIDAFLAIDRDFILDIYPARDNELVSRLRALDDSRIRLHRPLPRQELFSAVRVCDAAISFYPDTILYRSVSPTKTLEYYGLGIPAIMNHLPEHDELFDETCAFFCDFNRENIRKSVIELLDRPRSELSEMGQRGRDIVLAKRDYRVIADDLIRFLARQAL